MEDYHIKFSNVSFRYWKEQPWALKNITFSIRRQEWVAIIGHNGSGKSTLAKLMNGLLFSQEGDITVNDVTVSEDSVWDIRKKVGMVFQNPDNQFVGTTVRDDVAFGLENRGVSRTEMIKRIDESLAAVNMQKYQLHEPHRLSGGQKQRVAIASVLAVSPEVIILDEATAMLDPQGRQETLSTIKAIKDKNDLTLVTITHDLHEVLEADRIIVMNEGNVWFEGAPREVFARKNELLEIGLDIPFVAKLADQLSNLHLPLQHEPLNHEELLEELWTLHLRK